MAIVTYRDKVQAQAFKSGVQLNTKESLDWFRKQLRSMKRVSRQGLLKDPEVQLAKRVLPGRMYMYFYDPKHKKTLPYYDRFPLIFMVGPAKDGFYGINLHYLPPKLRASLMDNLYDIASDRRYDEGTKLRIKYSLLNGASKYRYFKPTFKHYLNAHVNSKFVKIDSSEWDIALFLPTERFEKAGKSRVFADSRKMIS